MKRTIYFVVERTGGWVINMSGVDPSKSPKCKRNAKEVTIAEAKLLAEVARPSTVRVLAKDGSIENEWIFEPDQSG